MYKDMNDIYNRNRKDVFVMAVVNLMDHGYRRILAVTDEQIEAIKGNEFMTDEFFRGLVRLSRDIARASTPSELMMFCEVKGIWDTGGYAPSPRIPYERMCEIATIALHYVNENASGDWSDWGAECAMRDIDLDEDEKEFFEIECEDEEDEEQEDY